MFVKEKLEFYLFFILICLSVFICNMFKCPTLVWVGGGAGVGGVMIGKDMERAIPVKEPQLLEQEDTLNKSTMNGGWSCNTTPGAGTQGPNT